MYFLKFKRVQLDLSASALSRKAGVGYHTIRQIESGRVVPTDAELAKLGAALGVDPNQLMVGVDATPLGDGAEARMSQRDKSEAK